ncbi:hypothetical protein KFK09_019195 [Dendrobium nobile]|uniref:Uncharacterized protein n=1 Tax=Dendrobium nobile TaxID=94219 RepID=A0A8T3AXX2_DENNO|nr:hypothetical protein KFK09_019195 [Dendrobium nobile]
MIKPARCGATMKGLLNSSPQDIGNGNKGRWWDNRESGLIILWVCLPLGAQGKADNEGTTVKKEKKIFFKVAASFKDKSRNTRLKRLSTQHADVLLPVSSDST